MTLACQKNRWTWDADLPPVCGLFNYTLVSSKQFEVWVEMRGSFDHWEARDLLKRIEGDDGVLDGLVAHRKLRAALQTRLESLEILMDRERAMLVDLEARIGHPFFPQYRDTFAELREQLKAPSMRISEFYGTLSFLERIFESQLLELVCPNGSFQRAPYGFPIAHESIWEVWVERAFGSDFPLSWPRMKPQRIPPVNYGQARFFWLKPDDLAALSPSHPGEVSYENFQSGLRKYLSQIDGYRIEAPERAEFEVVIDQFGKSYRALATQVAENSERYLVGWMSSYSVHRE